MGVPCQQVARRQTVGYSLFAMLQFRSGDSSFNNSTSFSTSGILQADTIAAAAERAGKKDAQVEWGGGRNAGIAGTTDDFANFLSTRGVLTFPVVTSEQMRIIAAATAVACSSAGSATNTTSTSLT